MAAALRLSRLHRTAKGIIPLTLSGEGMPHSRLPLPLDTPLPIPCRQVRQTKAYKLPAFYFPAGVGLGFKPQPRLGGQGHDNECPAGSRG